MNAHLRSRSMEDLGMGLADCNFVPGNHCRKVMLEPQVREKLVYSRPNATRCQGGGHAGRPQVLEQVVRARNQLDAFDFVLKQLVFLPRMRLNLFVIEFTQKVSKDFLSSYALTDKIKVRVAEGFTQRQEEFFPCA